MRYPKLIVMLTHHDVTVPDAKQIFLSAKDAPADLWGFKNVGLPRNEIEELVQIMKAAGKTTFLESVAYTEEDGLESARIAGECGFDYLLGANYYPSIQKAAESYGLKYMPFVGKRSNHLLYGTIEEIVDHARQVRANGTYGINLSGFRYVGDAPKLISELVKAMDVPVSVVGSIDSFEKLDLIKQAGPSMFTIGGAFFEHKFGDSFAEQISVVENYMRK